MSGSPSEKRPLPPITDEQGLRERLKAFNWRLASRDGRAARLLSTATILTHLGLVAVRGRAWTGDKDGLAFCEERGLIFREKAEEAAAELTTDGEAVRALLAAIRDGGAA
jgi:hypothetical protein